MAGLLGYALAGAAAGVGEGLVEQAKAAREQAFRMLEIGARREEAAASRALTVSEGEKGRANQALLLGKSQEFQAGQNAAEREQRAIALGLQRDATEAQIAAEIERLAIAKDTANTNTRVADAAIANDQTRTKIAERGEARADKVTDATIKNDDARLGLAGEELALRRTESVEDRKLRADAVANLTSNDKGELVAITTSGKTKAILDGDGKPLKPLPEGASSASKASVYTATLKALTEMGEDTVTAIEIAREIAGLPATPTGGGLTGEGAASPAAPPAAAIEMLKADPSLADQFDAKFGPGAAARALGK